MPDIRSIDKSILTLCHAIASDYLGLLYLNRKDGKKDLGKSSAYFLDVIDGCEKAEELLESIGDSGEDSSLVKQLVPVDMWRLIANDNLARISLSIENSNPLDQFKKVVNLRKSYIDGAGDDFEIAHYPQLALRCAEIVRYLTGVNGNSDLPVSSKVTENKEDIRYFMGVAKESYIKFSSISSLKNYRFITYYDINILISIFDNNQHEIANSINDLVAKYENSYKTTPQALGFSKGVLERVTSYINSCSGIVDELSQASENFKQILFDCK